MHLFLRLGGSVFVLLFLLTNLQAEPTRGPCPSDPKKAFLESFTESFSWVLFPWGKIHAPNSSSWIAETVHRVLLTLDRFRAERGSPSAAYELGRATYFGLATSPNEMMGLTWLLLAADQGDHLARYTLAAIGFCRYAKSPVVPGQPFAKRNYADLPEEIKKKFTEEKCRIWLAEAVEAGYPKAIRLRAFVPEKVAPDKIEALKDKLLWLEKAAAAGDPYAEYCRWDLIGYDPPKRSWRFPTWVWTPTGTP